MNYFNFINRLLVLLVVLFAGIGVSPVEADKKHIIKFATLAPEGSSWMKSMHKLSDKVKKATDGNVAFQFYPGGVSGDEIDVIRKMRIGQLHGAGFTGVGLGQVLPEVRVLDLPFLFDSDEEIQHVYSKMNGYFKDRYEEKGYVLLGWVPVGWVHFFSQQPIRSVDDLRQSKPWMWEGDPLVEQVYKGLGVQPIPLSITDVLLSLQTGMVNTVYASTQGALALQWFTKVKHVTRLRMGYATGGVLISKNKFDKLPQPYQDAVRKIGAECLQELVHLIQEDNLKAHKVLEENDVKWVALPDEKEKARFREAGAIARKNLAGKKFPAELLDQVLNHLATRRGTTSSRDDLP
ncbi:MAG: TRAP transporter substrate-binding protein DctP [Nitrospinae bacterium]|nr:TRAP transporter substrate-binding protein DctP [Nitrospinota bacterium]MBL7019751.1 TRAP transporter substrate-binding protein DctP [Nitrospinaceae bacterium]